MSKHPTDKPIVHRGRRGSSAGRTGLYIDRNFISILEVVYVSKPDVRRYLDNFMRMIAIAPLVGIRPQNECAMVEDTAGHDANANRPAILAGIETDRIRWKAVRMVKPKIERTWVEIKTGLPAVVVVEFVNPLSAISYSTRDSTNQPIHVDA